MEIIQYFMVDDIQNALLKELALKFNKHASDKIIIPPPVFIKMEGKVVWYDLSEGIMEIMFPVKTDYMNPFGSMQGGMIAAAIDNTLGPLSMLVGRLNYSRQLEIKYRKLIQLNIENITVIAKYEKQKKRQLFFSASVLDAKKNELASAKAIHWIIGE